MCVSVVRHISETSETIVIKFDAVTASVTRMHHVFIIWTLNSIQDHTDLNHENKNCSIIFETIQTMPIKFTVKIFRLKVYIICSVSDVRDVFSSSQLRLKLDSFITCIIIVIFQKISMLLHSNSACR